MLLFYHCCRVARLLLSDCLLRDQTKLEFAQDSSKSCKMELSKFLHGLFEIVPWICQVLYSVSSLVVPKMEEGISGTGAVKNSK